MMSIMLVLSNGVALAEYFVGTRGNDQINGTNGRDEIYGLQGNDRLNGRGRADYIEGGTGRDRLIGGSGGDEIYGGRGQDKVFGNDGDDYINVADDGQVDEVDCGAGTDTVVYDWNGLTDIDIIDSNCEDQQAVVA